MQKICVTIYELLKDASKKVMTMISVVMSCYNENKILLGKSIFSILNQTYPNFEFIIVLDDPHNEDLLKTLKNFRNIDNRIRILINPQNIGLASSLNRGIALSKGKYIARMDADDISLPTRFAQQIEYIEEHNMELIGAWYKEISEDEKRTVRIVRPPITTDRIYRCLRYFNCIVHPTFFARREVFEKVGGYADVFIAEDFHFLLKCMKKGVKLGNLPSICLKYRLRETSLTHSKSHMFYVAIRYYLEYYDKIFEINENTFQRYFYSNAGKRHIYDYNIWKNKSSLLKLYQKNNYSKFLFEGIKAVFSNSCARWSLKKRIAAFVKYIDTYLLFLNFLIIR